MYIITEFPGAVIHVFVSVNHSKSKLHSSSEFQIPEKRSFHKGQKTTKIQNKNFK